MLTAKPLEGVKVLEMGHSFAAPFAGLILAELGADVVKLENPGKGDHTRGWGPPFTEGTATAFHVMNRNKRGIAVDLSSAKAVEELRFYIRDEIDVLVHNLKPGALDRLGLGAGTLMQEKPQLIYCNITAFGAVGPMKDQPGYDPMVQAFSGMMSLMGEDGRPPVRVAVSINDIATGMWSAIGIIAALREHERTNAGGVVDASLLETALSWMSLPLAGYMVSGALPRREGSGLAEIVPYQAFLASDGHMMISAGNDSLFRRLCEAIGHPEIARVPDYETNKGRVENRTRLIPLLEKIFRERPRQEWFDTLEPAGVPCSPIQTLDQVLAHPQVDALRIIQEAPDAAVRVVGLPLSFDGARPAFESKAPRLGEHNEEILRAHERSLA